MQEVSQICPPHCAFPYRLLDKIVHYSEMSKTRKSPRKSLPERWEPYQKRAGTVSPTCGGMMHGGSSVFRTYHRGGALPSHDSLQRLTSDRQQEPLVCTAVRISDVCSKLAYALLCGDAPCAWDTHTEHAKAAQNGVCAVTEAFTEHGRAWNTSPTPTFVPRFRCQNALSSANMVNNSILLSGANPKKARFSA